MAEDSVGPGSATECQPGPATGFSLWRYCGWQIKLDLRSIKSTKQMRELHCKTPEMVPKEIWAHALAYNLIRTVMAQAAATHEVLPRSLSFKGALQTREAFQPLLELRADQREADRLGLYQD